MIKTAKALAVKISPITIPKDFSNKEYIAIYLYYKYQVQDLLEFFIYYYYVIMQQFYIIDNSSRPL
jgi:hypothetical protein